MKYCIGFDIGGTKCAVSLGEIADGNIRIIEREETPTVNCPQETLSKLDPFVKAWVAETGAKTAGISCGGPLNSQTGVIVCPPNLAKGWHGFVIVDYVKRNLDYPQNCKTTPMRAQLQSGNSARAEARGI